jgi:hypothetical protein
LLPLAVTRVYRAHPGVGHRPPSDCREAAGDPDRLDGAGGWRLLWESFERELRRPRPRVAPRCFLWGLRLPPQD